MKLSDLEIPGWARELGLGKQLEKERATRQAATARALGARKAEARRALQDGWKSRKAACDKADADVRRIEQQLADARQKRAVAHSALAEFAYPLEREIDRIAHQIRTEHADPKLVQLRADIESLRDGMQRHDASPYRYESVKMWRGIQQVDVTTESNYDNVRRRLEAIPNAISALDEAAGEYHEDVDAVVAQIVAMIPFGLAPETPMEKVERAEGLSAA